MEVLQVTESLTLGEGPHWDESTQSLYFVDIFGRSIHKYVPSTKKHTKAVIEGGNVSLFIPVENQKDKFVITIDCKLVVVTWDGTSEKVSKVEEFGALTGVTGERFNDGKTDSKGRLWLGTMGTENPPGNFLDKQGSFYTWINGSLKKHFGEVGISNGLAWHLPSKSFYYIDSLRKSVDRFDYDEATGTISNRKTVFDLEKVGVPGLPDGMTIDTDGNLWVAVFNGSRVIKIDPTKPNTLLKTVTIPGVQVTSCAFGGPNLDELYVTTAKLTINDVKLESPNGATFKVIGTGSKGFAGVKIKM